MLEYLASILLKGLKDGYLFTNSRVILQSSFNSHRDWSVPEISPTAPRARNDWEKDGSYESI